MDENNVNRLDTVLGVQEDKSAGSKIKSFIKKVGKIPEKQEVKIQTRADFSKTNKEFNKNLKTWSMAAKLHAGIPLINYFIGDKHKINATKKLFADMEKTARKSVRKYSAELDGLLGDTNKPKNNIFDIGGDLGEVKTAHDNNIKSRAEKQERLNTLTEEYNTLLAKQEHIGLRSKEASTMDAMENVRKNLAELEKARDKEMTSAFDNVQPIKTIDTHSTKIKNDNKELAKLAAGLYSRTGDDKLFKTLEKQLDASIATDKQAITKIEAKLQSENGRIGGLTKRLNKLKKEPKTDERDKAITEIKNQITKAEATIKRLNRDKKIAEQYLKLDTSQKEQYQTYYDNRDKPQDFGKDKNYRTEEFDPKFDAMMRKKTSHTQNMVNDVNKAGSDKALTNINKQIDEAYDKIGKLQIKLQEISAKKVDLDVNTDGDTEETITKQIEEKKKAIKDSKKALDDEKKAGEKLVDTFHRLKLEVRNTTEQLKLLKQDMHMDPIYIKMQSNDLQKYNDVVDNIDDGVNKIGKSWRKSNVITRLCSRILLNIRSQIADMINPLTLFRKGWDSWLNRFDNLPWKNTFEVVAYNFVTAFEPVFEWFARTLIKVLQVINVFTKKFAGVDLFDKSAWQLEQIKKGVGQLTAGFDELHASNENPNQFNTVFDTMEIAPLDPETEKKWEETAEKVKEVWDNTVEFVQEHPVASAVIGGGLLLLPTIAGSLLGLFGKGILKGITTIGKGIWNAGVWAVKGLIDPNTWKKVGTFFGNIGTKVTGFLGKELYTGAGAWGTKAGVTMGKALLGGTMLVGGTIASISIGANAGKNWQDLSTGMKAVSVVGAGLTAGMAGLGAVMLGASGPVGWAVAGVVALTSFVVGMSQVQDGIKSVKKEQKAWEEAQQNLAIANENVVIATNNYASSLQQLEELERQTGLSGEELYNSVQNGILPIEQMSSAQLQVYNAYVQTKEAADQLTTAQADKVKWEKAEAEGMIRTALAARKKKDDYVEAKDAILKAVEEEKISTEEAADYFSRLMGNMKDDARQALMEEIPEHIRGMVEPTKYASGWEKFGIGWKNFWSGLAEGTKTLAGNIGQAIADGWENIKNKASEKWNEITTAVSDKWEALKTKASDTWENIKTKTSEAWDSMKTAVSTKIEETKTAISNGWETIKTGASTAWDNITSSLSTHWENIKTKASETWENIKGKASETWDNMKTTASEKLENVKTAASEKWEQIKNSAIGTKLQEIFTNVKDKWEDVKTKTTEIFTNVTDTAKDKWENIKTTITDKATSAWEKAKEKFTDLKTKATEAWDNMKTKAAEKWKSISDTITTKAKSAWEGAKKWFDSIAEKAKNTWEKVKNWFSGDGWKTNEELQVTVNGKDFNSYAVGTNYVPNDQLAMIHKGEAIIPAKYNKPYTPPSSNSELEGTISAMTQEIANLRGLIQSGIPVKGEFKQRGSDLVAVVEKGRYRNGNSTLSNPAYAR